MKSTLIEGWQDVQLLDYSHDGLCERQEIVPSLMDMEIRIQQMRFKRWEQ